MNLTQMIDDTKMKIVTVLNESKLPIEIMDLVLENILLTVRSQASKASGDQTEGKDGAD